MPNCDPRDGFFYPTLTLKIDPYNIPIDILKQLSRLIAAINLNKTLETTKSIMNLFMVKSNKQVINSPQQETNIDKLLQSMAV